MSEMKVISNDGETVVWVGETKEELIEGTFVRPPSITKDALLAAWPVGVPWSTSKFEKQLSIPPHVRIFDLLTFLGEPEQQNILMRLIAKLRRVQTVRETIEQIIAPTYDGDDEELLRKRRFFKSGFKLELYESKTHIVHVWKEDERRFISFTPKSIAEEKTEFLKLRDDKGRE